MCCTSGGIMIKHRSISIGQNRLCWPLLVCIAALSGCSSAGPGDEHVDVSQSDLTGTITISGKVTNTAGQGVAGVVVTLAGKVSTSVTTDGTGNYAFSGLSAGSYSVRPTKLSCVFSPDVVNLNNLSANKTQNFASSGSGCSGTATAMVLIDSRL